MFLVLKAMKEVERNYVICPKNGVFPNMTEKSLTGMLSIKSYKKFEIHVDPDEMTQLDL